MHLYILNDISFPSPEADIEFLEVMGKDGDVALDKKRLKGVNFAIPVKIKLPDNVDVNQIATEISNWLKTDVNWQPLRFSGSTKYEYIAMCTEQFDVAETLKQYGRTVITFRLKPYKRRIDNRSITLSNGTTLFNSEKRPSKPLITIDGQGDITLQNNGVNWLVLTAVDGSIVINSEMMSVYRAQMPQFYKMNSSLSPMFPQLDPGDNKITWTGTVTKLEIEPRWEAIL